MTWSPISFGLSLNGKSEDNTSLFTKLSIKVHVFKNLTNLEKSSQIHGFFSSSHRIIKHRRWRPRLWWCPRLPSQINRPQWSALAIPRWTWPWGCHQPGSMTVQKVRDGSCNPSYWEVGIWGWFGVGWLCVGLLISHECPHWAACSYNADQIPKPTA
jgi:hypothetical protein